MDRKHPIESLMTTTMDSLRDMVDVNTVIGEPINTQDGTTVIPISRVSFGFVAGGGEYGESQARQVSAGSTDADIPFAGGAGAGVTVTPLGFLVTSGEQVRLVPAQYCQSVDRLIELIPQAMAELRCAMKDKRPAPRHGKSEAVAIPVTGE